MKLNKVTIDGKPRNIKKYAWFGCQFDFSWALQTIWRVVWGNQMSSRVGHNKPGGHLGWSSLHIRANRVTIAVKHRDIMKNAKFGGKSVVSEALQTIQKVVSVHQVASRFGLHNIESQLSWWSLQIWPNGVTIALTVRKSIKNLIFKALKPQNHVFFSIFGVIKSDQVNIYVY